MAQFYTLVGVPTTFDSEHKLVTSPFFSPSVLAFLRLLLALYATATAIVVLYHDSIGSFTYFSYFTNLSYVGLVSYFWAAGVQTAAYVRAGRKGYPLQRWPRPLQFLHLLLFSTIVTFPIIVLIVVWAILYDPTTYWATRYSTWSNISCHAMNGAFALFEVIFTNVGPMPWIHLLFLIILLALYLAVAYITRATQGFYTYGFLNPATEHAKVALYVFGIAIAAIIIWILMRYIIVLRERLVQRRRARTVDHAELIGLGDNKEYGRTSGDV